VKTRKILVANKAVFLIAVEICRQFIRRILKSISAEISVKSILSAVSKKKVH